MVVSAIPEVIYRTLNGAVDRIVSSSFFGLAPSLVLIDMRAWWGPLSGSQARSHHLTFPNTSIPYWTHDTLHYLRPFDCAQCLAFLSKYV